MLGCPRARNIGGRGRGEGGRGEGGRGEGGRGSVWESGLVSDLSQRLVPSCMLTFTIECTISIMQASLPSGGFAHRNVDSSSVVSSCFCRRLRSDSFFFRDLDNFTDSLFRLLDIQCSRYCISR